MKGFAFRFLLLFAAVFAVLFMLVWTYMAMTMPAQAAEPQKPVAEPVRFAEVPLKIETAGGTHHFTVGLAKTAVQLKHGLMWRETMPADAGMVFDFGRSRDTAMWMKNTLISLDMLFGDENRQIVHIAERTQPLSLNTIHAPKPVRYVIELNAGTARRLGIKVGDHFEIGK